MPHKAVLLGTCLCVVASGVLLYHAESRQPIIMLFGDSLCSPLSQFYFGMQRVFPAAQIIPNGRMGAPTWARRKMLAEPDFWKVHPDLIIVLMGVNNHGIDPRSTPQAGADDLDAIYKAVRAKGWPVLIGTPLPYARVSPRDGTLCPPTWSNQFVQDLRAIILQRLQPDVIDFDEVIPVTETDRWFEDCLHPNADGGQRMAHLVHTILCKRRFRSEFASLCADE